MPKMGESLAQAPSLHGENAARRQAVTELLFFAGVGDLTRCLKIVATWGIKVSDGSCCDYDKRTPLHLAAAEGAFSVVEWLLNECGVDINPLDRFNRTPLEDAVRGDHGMVANLLVEKGGRIRDRHGELIPLADSALSGAVRLMGEEYDPDWEIVRGDLELTDKIGEGEFGEVFKARWHGTMVAVKVLKDTDAVALGDFQTELNVLQKVHHPHAVQFLGACTKQKPFMIVTELMTGGSLADFFRNPNPISLRRRVELALNTALGMAYLHSRRPNAIVHRDLKPANLMLTGHAASTTTARRQLALSTGVLKIADFGLSKTIRLGHRSHKLSTGTTEVPISVNGEGYKMTGETGSYRYMAPEVFRHEPYDNKVDVYAFAMIAFQLFQGLPPFWELDAQQTAKAASLDHRRPIWSSTSRWGEAIPAELQRLVEECWHPNHSKRPEFEDIIRQLEAVLAGLPAGADSSGSACCTIQ